QKVLSTSSPLLYTSSPRRHGRCRPRTARARDRWAARCRRLAHADRGCRHHQRRDDHDRGEGCRSGARATAARGMTLPAGSAGHNCCPPSSASREGSPMTENTAKAVNNLGYHAHIYYDPTSTRALAEGVCAALGEHFQVEIEAFRDTPVGPHPRANVLVLFKPDQFAHVVPYLMLHRDGLDVLVHPLTEDAVEDHTDFAMW